MNKLYKPDETLRVSERIYKTGIHGLWYLSHKTHRDERGFFREVAIISELESIRYAPFNIKQINHSRSEMHVTRGFHSEAWDKLITVFNGVCFCALADIRPDSSTFALVETFLLGNGDEALDGSLFISQGIANSVCVIQGPIDYMYGVNKLYKDRDLKRDRAISLFDPDLLVEWPISRDRMVISDRDVNSVTLRQLFPYKFKS